MTSRYIPIYLFAAFIIILLVVLTFVAKDENQKIYRPGTLEKYLLQKAARIHQHIRQTLRGFAQRPALPAHIPETRADGDTLTFHGALSHNGILDSDWFRRQSGGALPAHIIIDGDLTLHGALNLDGGIRLTISGNARIDSLTLDDATLDIHGDLDAALAVCATSPAAVLRVGGALRSPYLLACGDEMPGHNAHPDHIYIDDGAVGYMPASADGNDAFPLDDSIGRGAHGWYTFHNAQRMLRPETRDADDHFSPARTFALIQSGENPFIRPPSSPA